ncbi:hypothetical protein GCM10022402_40400 [Salinactinospora qingdaonensis]|uniref:Uncharacterized protein n=1 Tax=Salinactinospora qingdaonensis TaxID=702744 RepID=A0ABP7G928_9ACTN
MAERGQLTREVPDVDALATAVRLAAVGQQGDTQWVIVVRHVANPSASGHGEREMSAARLTRGDEENRGRGFLPAEPTHHLVCRSLVPPPLATEEPDDHAACAVDR